MDKKTIFKITEYTLKLVDQNILSEEFEELNSILSAHSDAARYYNYLMMAIGNFQERGKEIICDEVSIEDVLKESFWQEMSDYEKTALAVEIPKPEEEPMPVEESPSQDKKLSISVIFSIAALVFVILFVYFAPVHSAYYGQITDTCQAVFAESMPNLRQGGYVKNELIKLKEGLVRVQMNDGSHVILEAPSEFRLEKDSRVFLSEGKLAASVPKRGIGFTVRTPSASIVDFGTEFGVLVDKDAVTEAHVQKGQVEMRLGSNLRSFNHSMRLNSGQAGRIAGQGIQRIPIQTIQFSYHIPSPFEMRAKEFNPSLYLQVTDNGLDSFKASARNQIFNIETGQGLTVVECPELGMGKATKALRISGSENAISIPSYSQALSSLQNPRGFFSLGFWVRFDSIGEQVISSFLVDGMGIKDYYRVLFINKEGMLDHCAYEPSRQNLVRHVVVSDPLKPNTWYFIMIVRDGETVDEKSVYVNGKLGATDIRDRVGTGNVGHFKTMQFGGDFATFKGFSGELAEILFIPRALTAEEIESLYQSAINNQGSRH